MGFSVTGAYRRGVVSFRSDIPQRNKVDDLTALALLGENVYAEEFDFGNRQIFPNPIRREAEAFYTYRLDSLYEKDGITYRRIAFRGLSGLNHGTVTIDATHGQLAILEMRVMMKGVITESYRVELGEVEPGLFLPIGLSVVIDRNRLWASLHNGYSASISYPGEQLDKTIRLRIAVATVCRTNCRSLLFGLFAAALGGRIARRIGKMWLSVEIIPCISMYLGIAHWLGDTSIGSVSVGD